MTQGRSRSHWGGDWYDTDRDAHRRDVAGSGAGGLRRRLAGARRRRNEGRAIADGIGFAGCGAGGRVGDAAKLDAGRLGPERPWAWRQAPEIGKAACRERVGPDVYISVVAGP